MRVQIIGRGHAGLVIEARPAGLGLACKAVTDDARGAAPFGVTGMLLTGEGPAPVCEPAALANAWNVGRDRAAGCEGSFGAADGDGALAIVVGRDDLRSLDAARTKGTADRIAVDARNVLGPEPPGEPDFGGCGMGR